MLLAGALLLYLGLVVNLQLLKFGSSFLLSLHYATGGWLTSTLITGLIGFALIIGGWLIGYGRLAPSTLGLVGRTLPVAAVALTATWAVGQALAGITSLLFEHRLTAAVPSLSLSLPLLLAQLLGNALLEESLFRGYLIPFLRPYLRNSTPLVVIATSVIFGVSHIPGLLATGQPFVTLIPITILGFLFGWLYIRTGNLWLCIGLHSLFNRPTLIWSSHIPGEIVPLLVMFFFIAFSTRLFRMQTFQFPSQGVGV